MGTYEQALTFQNIKKHQMNGTMHTLTKNSNGYEYMNELSGGKKSGFVKKIIKSVKKGRDNKNSEKEKDEDEEEEEEEEDEEEDEEEEEASEDGADGKQVKASCVRLKLKSWIESRRS